MRIPLCLKRFAQKLQDASVPEDVYNFYAAPRTNRQRRNLELYLAFMYAMRPKTLLVGEAPGYNGCARTGVPFSSEKLLREGVLGGRLFGAHNGFHVNMRTARSEQSAGAMWELLEHAKRLPLLWNAYPFHPHLPGNPDSNRKPRLGELQQGAPYLPELIGLFGIEEVIAVGNAAQRQLERCGIAHRKVRHPSYGGRREFATQLGELLSQAPV